MYAVSAASLVQVWLVRHHPNVFGSPDMARWIWHWGLCMGAAVQLLMLLTAMGLLVWKHHDIMCERNQHCAEQWVERSCRKQHVVTNTTPTCVCVCSSIA